MNSSNRISASEFEKLYGNQVESVEAAPVPKTTAKKMSAADFEKNFGDQVEDVEQPSEEGMSFGQAAKSAGRTLFDTTKAFARGGLEGIKDTYRGIKQIGLEAAENPRIVDSLLQAHGLPALNKSIAPEGTSKAYTDEVNKEKVAYGNLPETKAHPVASFLGQLGGGLISTAPVGALSLPAKAATAGKGILNAIRANPLARTSASMGTQGAVAGGAQFDPTQEGRAGNIVTGATIGVALPAAGNFVKRLFKGSNKPEEVANQLELLKLQKEHDISLLPAETRGSVGGKYVNSLLERVPGSGMVGDRKQIAKQFQNDANKLRKEIGGDDIEDYGAYLEGALQETNKQVTKKATRLFNKVEKTAEMQGGKVEFKEVDRVARDMFEREMKLKPAFRDEKKIENLQKFLSMEPEDFATARLYRDKIDEILGGAPPGRNASTADRVAYAQTFKLKKAMEKDIDDYAEQGGGLLKKEYDEARQFYKDRKVPFKKRMLSTILVDDQAADTLVGKFLKPDAPRLASNLIKNSGDKGLTAARGAIMHNAYESATQGDFFNPLKFAKEVKRLGSTNKIVFTPEQTKYIDGFEKLAKASEQTSHFAANPNNGGRLLGPVVGGLAAALGAYDAYNGGDHLRYILTGAGGILAARFMNSAAGRRILTRAAELDPKDKKGWRKLLSQANEDAKTLVPAVATLGFTQPSADESRQALKQ